MNDQHSESLSEDSGATDNEDVSRDRRAALTKIAYGSPAIAALLLSKSAAAQQSCGMGGFSPPCPP